MIPEAKKIEELNKIIRKVAEFESKGDISKAIELLDKARRAYPEDGNLLNHLGDLYVRANRVDEAVAAYELGVEAYRKDSFYRNAIGLGKKALRYAPDRIEMYLTVAELLVDLGQRADAASYFSNYLDKLMKTGRTDDAMEVCKNVLSSGLSDANLLKKIDEIYSSAGLKDKKKMDVREVIKLKEAAPKEIEEEKVKTEEKVAPVVEKPAVIEEKKPGKPETYKIAREVSNFKEVGEMVEKAINAFSEHQKNAVGILHKSLEHQIADLVKIVAELKTSSQASVRETDKMIAALSDTVATFAEKEDTTLRGLTGEIKDRVHELTERIREGTDNLTRETKRYSVDTKAAFDDIGSKFEGLKDTLGGVSVGINESKTIISRLESSILTFLLRQEATTKKERFVNRILTYVITAATCVAVILLLLLVFKR